MNHHGHRRGWLLLPTMLAVAVRLPSAGYPLLFDDLAVVADNPYVNEPQRAKAIWTEPSWWQQRPAVYRPLTTATFALGNRARVFSRREQRWINIALHAINTWLVSALALWLTSSVPAAVFAGAILAVHPVTVESVQFLVGRADLLAAAAVLAGWLNHAAARRAATWRRSLLAGVLLTAGLLSKENAIVLPAVAVLTDLSRRRADGERAAPSMYAAYACAMAAYAILRLVVVGLPLQHHAGFLNNPVADAAWPVRAATSVAVLWRYVAQLLVPIRLSPDYSYAAVTAVRSWLEPQTLIGSVLLAGALIAGVRSLHHGGWGALPALAAWAPISNLLVPIGVLQAERLLYLPLAAAAVCLSPVFATATAGRRMKTAALIGSLALMAWTVRNGAYSHYWRDALSLWQCAVTAQPASARAHFGLGTALFDRGQLPEARAHLRRALAIFPDYGPAHYNIGLLCEREGDVAQAVRHYQAAARAQPPVSKAWLNLGALRERGGDIDHAENCYEQAIQVDPRNCVAWFNLGALRHRTHRVDEAVTAYRRALSLNPGYADAWSNLGVALRQLGRMDEAIAAHQRAVALSPWRDEFHANLGYCYEQRGDWPAAMMCYRFAVDLAPGAPKLRYHLGLAAARAGEMELASEQLRQLREDAPSWATKLEEKMKAASPGG